MPAGVVSGDRHADDDAAVLPVIPAAGGHRAGDGAVRRLLHLTAGTHRLRAGGPCRRLAGHRLPADALLRAAHRWTPRGR